MYFSKMLIKLNKTSFLHIPRLSVFSLIFHFVFQFIISGHRNDRRKKPEQKHHCPAKKTTTKKQPLMQVLNSPPSFQKVTPSHKVSFHL